MKISDIDKSKVTPMMKQYLEIKENNPDIILFFRLGDFYEMFFEDAILCSRELEITLTGKSAGLEERIPMCGVPFHSVSPYINKLVQKGYKVGICEQTSDPKESKGIVERGITQIITKGTIANPEDLDERINNYLGAALDTKDGFLLTWADISTGDIYITQTNHDFLSLATEIINLGLKEIILKENNEPNLIKTLKENFNILVNYFENTEEPNEYNELLKNLNDVRQKQAVSLLLNYITDTQKRTLNHFKNIIFQDKKNHIHMDPHTKRNLELTETIRNKERTYSLLWLLDKTKTAMGSRLLKRWIENPSTDKKELNLRYDTINTLSNEFILKEELRNLLDSVYDLERLSGKIAYGNANARDMLQLLNSITTFPEIKKILKQINFDSEFSTLDDLKNLLQNSIFENPPYSLREGYLIKDGYNQELDELKSLRKGGKEFIAKLEKEEKEKTNIPKLKVGFNKVFGYFIEVPKGNIKDVKEEFGYIRKQTLANCERYITQGLKEKEDLILSAEEKIINLEYNLFNEIKEETSKYIKEIQKAVNIISKIDVIAGFTILSEKNNYVRPEIIETNEIEIKNGRHPVVEQVVEDEFVENDIIMDKDTNILLITGPNMSGKSTYMRQIANIIIMAQIGSFVPAESAKLPIFDKIFTRIGASDDLVSGESTFMVEMKEAGEALQNATKDSLILFDELGRGTATYDGMSLAQSIIEYIHEKIKCKTFFATHYHELTSLDETLKNLKNVHVSALEENGQITFLHKIKEGPVDKSYGIHVAELAKLPETVIKRAKTILTTYENKEHNQQNISQLEMIFDTPKETSKLKEKIDKIEANNLTPIDALNLIYELKEEAKNE